MLQTHICEGNRQNYEYELRRFGKLRLQAFVGSTSSHAQRETNHKTQTQSDTHPSWFSIQ